MKYEPSKRALTSPETDPAILASGPPWTLDAQCAELSRLAYFRFEKCTKQKAALEAALEVAGFGKYHPFNKSAEGAQGFGVVDGAGNRFAVFRGTQVDDLHDIMADGYFIPCKWSGGDGRVHRGFLKQYLSLKETIDIWLASSPNNPLIITGHSLGAAIATLMAGSQPGAELVTFGSPLVGNRVFARQFRGRKVRRYVDCADIVPRLPPPIGFKHLGGLHYIDRLGKVRPAPPNWMVRCAERLRAELAYISELGWRPGNAFSRELADHTPINYVSAVLGRRDGP